MPDARTSGVAEESASTETSANEQSRSTFPLNGMDESNENKT